MTASLFKRVYSLALILAPGLSIFDVSAQTITNLGATFANGMVTVTYDVQGTHPDQTFSLDLYSSIDNFTAPLKAISGDVGKAVKAGTNKKILWNAAAEMGNFDGDLTFKVKGLANALPYTFKSPEGGSRKMGKPLTIAWQGGLPEETVTLQLFKDNTLVTDIGQTRNNGTYTWAVPKKLEKGSYTLKLTGKTETVQSSAFEIKSQMPLLLKIVPAVVVAGIVVVVLPKGGGGGGDPIGDDLPAAPGPN
ncbi:MAG: hypothetical protein O2887_17050 [Bacteroidetes bacterium]|nr:hypothetical protein [Bacteroidota bacterium]MDA1122169.1 hypothetical protein [Bacteroidota bacterium]